MGIRKKIMFAFTCLGMLLFFAGMVSLFELNKLSKMTKTLLESSTRTMEVSKRMLDAVQDQNTALLQMIVTKSNNYDSLFHQGRKDFESALADATVTIRDLSELDSIYIARERYNNIVDNNARLHDDDWFLDVYKTTYYQLTAAIKSYMTSSSNSLSTKALMLESNAYRVITPSVIALGAAILLIIMFAYFLNIFYIKPVINITKGLNNYLYSKVPFNVKVEGKDEVLKLRDLIDSLINMLKVRKNE